MAREWKPGDVALVHGQVALAWRDQGSRSWVYTDEDGDSCSVASVAEARPLVVIDPEDRKQVSILTLLYCAAKSPEASVEEAMQAALRDLADPKPAKPEEPTGLGAVVRTVDEGIWIRVKTGEVQPWVKGTQARFYSDIDAVEVLSQGVTP